ncbi:MAG: sugar phosphate isomerase/epimerase family protein [Pseudohongiellaceae bacterium]
MKSLYNRRKFLKTSSLLSAASLVGGMIPGVVSAAQSCTNGRLGWTPGVQTYMLRSILSRNTVDVFESLAEIGYQELELFGFGGDLDSTDSLLFGLSLTRFSELISSLGFTVPCAHINNDGEDAGYAGELVDALNIKYLIEPLAQELLAPDADNPDRQGLATVAQVQALGNRLNRRAERIAELGAGFAYHNHSLEFETIDGETCWDILMANTDPDLVKIELDVGWVAVAERDPVELLQQYSGRVVATHMKDYASDRPLPEGNEPFGAVSNLVPPGSGTVDFAAINRQLDIDGVEHRFVEVDVTNSPLADATSGLCHLASLR